MLLLAFLRLFSFPLHESPRYLLGRGRDGDAVAIVHEIARYNGTQTGLTVEDLEEAVRSAEKEGTYKWRVLSEGSAWTVEHVRALFATKKMAWSTSLLIWIWGMYSASGMATVLTQVAHRQGLSVSRRHYTTISYHICGWTSSTIFPRLLTQIFSLASRGAKFQDATYFTTYRNVSAPNSSD